MPAEFRIRYLPAAQEDLLGILDFVAQDSPGRATEFVEELDRRIGGLGLCLFKTPSAFGMANAM